MLCLTLTLTDSVALFSAFWSAAQLILAVYVSTSGEVIDAESAKLIVDLSKTIGTQIVVEGVEHSNQYELLRELGADYIQGYYFSKPLPREQFLEFVSAKNIVKESF